MTDSKSDSGGDRLAIRGLGMASALGLDVATSCAAARAGILRTRDLGDALGWNDETAEVEGTQGHEMPSVTKGFVGVGRLVRLGVAALDDLRSHVDLGSWARLGMVINVPSGYYLGKQFHPDPTADPLDDELEEGIQGELESRCERIEERLIPRLLALSELAVAPAARHVVLADEAGLIVALRQAKQWLSQGLVDACIVGGIESQIDPEMLCALHNLGIVKTASLPVGRMPGEAAAMVLVEDDQRPTSRTGGRASALIGGLALEAEPADRFSADPPNGKALYRAVAHTLADLAARRTPPDFVIADLTGEELRANEWARVQIELRANGLAAPTSEWYPALHFGAIGAATGPVAICLACRGYDRGYGPSKATLVWLLSDAGSRGSFWIDRAAA